MKKIQHTNVKRNTNKKKYAKIKKAQYMNVKKYTNDKKYAKMKKYCIPMEKSIRMTKSMRE